MYHDVSRLYHDVSRNLGRGPRIEPGDTVYYDVSRLYHRWYMYHGSWYKLIHRGHGDTCIICVSRRAWFVRWESTPDTLVIHCDTLLIQSIMNPLLSSSMIRSWYTRDTMWYMYRSGGWIVIHRDTIVIHRDTVLDRKLSQKRIENWPPPAIEVCLYDDAITKWLRPMVLPPY